MAAGRLREELDEVHRFGSGILIRAVSLVCDRAVSTVTQDMPGA